MVSKTDHISNLFQNKAGLVEAILLPYLSIIDQVRVASLKRTIRKLFLPSSAHHINYLKVFGAILDLCETDESEDVEALKLAAGTSWFNLIKHAAVLMTKVRLAPNQSLGHTYIRFNK